MNRTAIACLAAAILAGPGVAAAAEPAGLMPEPLDGWTASGPVYGESVIEERASSASKRIEISRDYHRDKGSVRISLNTHNAGGAQRIDIVNEDPDTARALAKKGISPFPFGDYDGVMIAAEDGNLSGAALKLGRVGTLTVEGVLDGEPATVPMDHVRAYLRRADLKRMAAFVRQANARGTSPDTR